MNFFYNKMQDYIILDRIYRLFILQFQNGCK